jgi:exopolysaccharide biosynthesis polyprenyl glycosylphosphotransferase
MLKQQYRLVAFSLFLLDEAVTVAAFLAAFWLRAGWLREAVGRPLYPLTTYLPLLLVIVPAWAVSFWSLGLYRSHRTISIPREIGEIVRAVMAGGLVLALVIFLSRTGTLYSRLLIVLFLALNVTLLVVSRTTVRLAGRRIRARGYNFRNMVIVGVDSRAADFDRLIADHPAWGLKVLGYLDAGGDQGERTVDPARIIGRLADLGRIIQEAVVDEVVFVVTPASLSGMEEAFLLCEEQGVRTRVIMEYFPRQTAKAYVEMIDGTPVMTFTTAPVNVTALAVKRVVDVLLSLFLLVLAGPLMLVIALLVRLSSPGPALFRQERCGLAGRRFTLLKFRSMHADAEARKAGLAHLNVMDGPVFKAVDDPRVTPVGRVIRRLSLDELPQLWNVLVGDMSFVGPRPPVPEEVLRYERWQRRRLSMKPGLTGLWQVSGRNTVDFNTWMKMDLDYIDRWSLLLDLTIILKTIPTVLSRKGAM